MYPSSADNLRSPPVLRQASSYSETSSCSTLVLSLKHTGRRHTTIEGVDIECILPQLLRTLHQDLCGLEYSQWILNLSGRHSWYDYQYLFVMKFNYVNPGTNQ